MGAIGNYEVVSEPFDLAGAVTVRPPIVVEVPAGKVALGWGYEHTAILDANGVPANGLNTDFIVSGRPASDGSSVTFRFYEEIPSVASARTVGMLYVTCAEMGGC